MRVFLRVTSGSQNSQALGESKTLEALSHDIEVLCLVQRRFLLFSALTSLNNDLLNDGVILENSNETVNMAFQKRIMERSMTEWAGARERETNEWRLRGKPDLLPDGDDDEMDSDNGLEDF